MALLNEIKYTTRLIQKSWQFNLICVFVIALGFSIAIPLYSIVRNFAYAPLPYPNGDRLVIVSQLDASTKRELTTSSFDQFQFNRIKENTKTLAALSIFHELEITLSDGNYAKQIGGGRITAETLSFSDTRPFMGRLIHADDQVSGAEPVVLISYGVWRDYYSGDPDVVGKISRVNKKPHTIIGVMPKGYQYPQSAQVWLPLTNDASAQPDSGDRVSIIGVLAEGNSRNDASAEISKLVEGLSKNYPDIYPNRSAKIIPFTHGFFSRAFTIFNSMGSLAFCIYLLVCLNIANLLLIRANDRVSELAIRKAMGSSRGRLFISVIIESFMVCSVGAAVGLIFGSIAIRFLQIIVDVLFPFESSQPFWFDFSVNFDIVMFSLLMLFFLWLTTGMFAAWRASSVKFGVSKVLNQGAKGMSSKESNWIGRTLVLSQIVISFFLLSFSGYLLAIFQSAAGSYAYKGAEHYASGWMELIEDRYSDAHKQADFRAQIRKELLQIPGVESVSFSTESPGLGGRRTQASLEPIDTENPSALPEFGTNWVDVGFFETFGIDLTSGRAFDNLDVTGSAEVIIVDEAFIKKMDLSKPVVGQRIFTRDNNIPTNTSMASTIIGVVPYIGPDSGNKARTPRAYRPIDQSQQNGFEVTLLLSSDKTVKLANLEREVLIAIAKVDRDVSIYGFESYADMYNRSGALPRLINRSVLAIVIGAMLLSAIGVYGLISRNVSTRQREIGIRRSIGSSNSRIIFIFLGQAFIYLTLGIILGGGLGFIAISLFTSSSVPLLLLASVSPIYAAVTSFIGILIFFASFIPAKKILQIEPGDALRYE